MNKYISKTRLIYFLSALVIIIGCYALNLSYSMFVQTEESNLVDASVPNITYTLTPTSYTVRGSSTEIISLNLTSTTSIPFYYVLTTISSTDYTVKLYDEENNSISGTLNNNESKTIKLAIINNTDSCKTVSFSLETEYTTINYDINAHEAGSNIDVTSKYSGYGTGFANTLLSKAQNNVSVGGTTYAETPITNPGIVNNIDEASLIPNEDDYGLMHYFRGNVIDNYVNFANKCWRIVRTTGNGGIELILDDKNVTCNSELYNGAFTIGSAPFGYTTETNSNNDTIKKENFLNSEETPSFYTTLVDYQTNTLNTYLNYLSENDWCYDNSAYETLTSTLPIEDTSSFYNNSINFYYGASLNINQNYKCSQYATKIKKINETTNLYVGSLTYNEVLFAGLQRNTSNINSYLYNNHQYGWSTLSLDLLNPSEGLEDLRKVIIYYSSYQNMITNAFVSSKYNIRPAIILNKDVIISSGTGIKTDPYEVTLSTNCE